MLIVRTASRGTVLLEITHLVDGSAAMKRYLAPFFISGREPANAYENNFKLCINVLFMDVDLHVIFGIQLGF